MRITHPGTTSESVAMRSKPATRSHRVAVFWHTAPMSLVEQMIFADNLGTMLEVGLPMYEVLEVIKEETKQSSTKRMLEDIQRSVQEGQSLAHAMGRYRRVFSPLIVSAIRVGEASGTLVPVLARVSHSLQKEIELRGKIMSALWYPALVLLVMGVVGVMFLNYVLPNLVIFFRDAQVSLPFYTQWLLSLHAFLGSYGTVLGIVVAGGIVVSLLCFRRTRVVGVTSETLALSLPLVGSLWRQILVVRFVQNLRTLLESGLPVTEAFTLMEETTGHHLYKSFLHHAGTKVAQGMPLNEALRHGTLAMFPSMSLRMIAIGERAGILDEVLEKLSGFYDRKIDYQLQTITALLSPGLTIIIGLAVAFAAISIMGPIYELLSSY